MIHPDKVSAGSMTLEAVYEGRILRPLQPLPLSANQRVTITVRLPDDSEGWPAETAAIYRDIAEEDRRLAEAMLPAVRATWPAGEDTP